jgi:hypothetical protein
MAALEHVASTMESPDQGEADLARALYVRFGVERAIERASMHAAALAGGMAFVASSEIAYLLAASRALAFHPPSRVSAGASLSDYLVSGRLMLM